MRPGIWCVALLLIVACAAGAQADDVTDQIDEALKAYRSHDPQTAIAALDAAANLLRQSRADGLKKLLPAAPPGWTADEAEGNRSRRGVAWWRHHGEPRIPQRQPARGGADHR